MTWLQNVIRYPVEYIYGASMTAEIALLIALLMLPFVMRRWVRTKVPGERYHQSNSSVDTVPSNTDFQDFFI